MACSMASKRWSKRSGASGDGSSMSQGNHRIHEPRLRGELDGLGFISVRNGADRSKSAQRSDGLPQVAKAVAEVGTQ